MTVRPNDPAQRKAMKNEIQAYLSSVKQQQLEDSMKDVYITDHKYKARKLNTTSADEDEHFYKYSQSLKQYYAEGEKKAV